MEEPKRYNEEFIELMQKLSEIMLKQGEAFRARAYQKAQETIMSYPDNITSTNQLKDKPGIGTTIMNKLNEYVETGTLQVLEREKTNPVNILAEIYGIGPVKAKQLVEQGITSIEELEQRQNELLNDVQKVGLQYHSQIQERIPRDEIMSYEVLFNRSFTKLLHNDLEVDVDSKFEIVGSYRRGATTSGDIDVIITGKNGTIYNKFIDEFLKAGIILEVLSRGPSKTLVIARLPGLNQFNENRYFARRIDFLYTPPDEFPFAILYFTGSKIFNTLMRQYAVNKGYTFNEHGIYHLENKKKTTKVSREFRTERDIFDFLGLEFKTPVARQDGRAVVPKQELVIVDEEVFEIIPVKKTTTLKKKAKNVQEVQEVKEVQEDVETQLIENFKSNGISVLNVLNENQLTNIIRVANNKYYNQTPIMTDAQYDIVKEYIEQKYPDNNVIREIGAEVERNKVTLPYEMASMVKIKSNTNDLLSWIARFKGPYIISCKLDGVSGLYSTEGDIPKLYTRGNGIVGQDVSHLIPFLRLPKTQGITIRGEFIILKEVFEQKYKNTFANPRNMVAGIINHKHINNAVNDLHFVSYEVIVPQLTPSQQMEYLNTINVECVQNLHTNSLSYEMLSELLVNWRETSLYEIDGIIITNDKIYPRQSGNPKHAFAFKMVLSNQIMEAKVVDVLWTPSKDGYLKPRVQIEPINIGGVTIEFATGFNGSFIQENNIGIGTIIELIRSGDVIPYIRSVIVPAPSPKMPSVPYKWNDTHVDIMIVNIDDEPIVKEKNITGFFKGVESLSSGNISRLIKAGYDTVPKIINMSEEDYLNVGGFKGKMANKIYTGIRQKLEETSIIGLMASSNIFGRGFNEKKIKLIINQIPNILISDMSEEEKIQEVASLKGMAIKTAEAFVYKIEDFKDFIVSCGLEHKLYDTSHLIAVNQEHELYNKSVVLTGTRDKTIIEFLETIGANQGSSVSKNTYMVIAKNKNEDTGKADEARKLNIPIMSVEEFIQTFVK